MKISYGQMEPEVRKSVEHDLSRAVEKLEKLLQHYEPDLVQFHVAMERIERTGKLTFSLNLAIPTGTLHANCDAADARACLKAAFAELFDQVKKHQAKLRKDYTWKRKRSRGVVKASEVSA